MKIRQPDVDIIDHPDGIITDDVLCTIRNCLEALRPYHGILLLYEERELLDKLPLDASPTLKKMLSHASPTNSFRTIASDSDLALLHVSVAVHFFQFNLRT